MALGAPKKEFDLKIVDLFGRFKATYQTMADYFGVSEKTIKRRMDDENGDFCQVYKKGFSDLKLRLSEAQIQTALKGSAPLLIFLGKQYLGQSDTPQEKTDEKEVTIKFEVVDGSK